MTDKVAKIASIPKTGQGMAKDSASHLRTRVGAANPFLENKSPATVQQATTQKPPTASPTKRD